MNNIKIELNLSEINPKTVSAVIAMMEGLKTVETGSVETTEATKETVVEALPEKKTRKARTTRTSAKKLAEKEAAEAAAKEEEFKEPGEDETPEAKEPAPTKTASKDGPTRDDVRAVLNDKLEDHRDDIKKKLSEMGENNVTGMDEANFGPFIEYLRTLN